MGYSLLLKMSQGIRVSRPAGLGQCPRRRGGRETGMARASNARTAAQNAPRGIAPNMAALVERFGTEEACERHMVSLRWPGGFECPRCGHRSYARVRGRREFRCEGCGWQFSATSGTAIAHTRVPLTKWFRAAFMVCADPRGASAQAVARECAVSDITGMSMLRRLRAAMGWAMRLCVVEGAWVEADEGSVACASSPADGRHPGRAPFAVAVSGSAMCARALSDLTAGSLDEFFRQHVSRSCEVRTDGIRSGAMLVGGWDLVRRPSARDGDSEASLPVVHHAISNLKAKLAGTFHGVSWGRLQEHLDEFSWKYSHRRGDQMADLLAELARWPHVPLSGIRALAGPQPPHPRGRDRWYKRDNALLSAWLRSQEAAP